jgi:Flp pilus assembly protein TadG
MMRGVGRRLFVMWRSDKGGALVELAVVLPVLILISIGVMDYGRVYFTSVAVANAARAAAEWGAYGMAGSDTKTAEMQAFGQLDGNEVGTIAFNTTRFCECGTTSVACSTTECGGGYGPAQVYVTVTATKTVALLIRYPGLPASVTISRSATFRSR